MFGSVLGALGNKIKGVMASGLSALNSAAGIMTVGLREFPVAGSVCRGQGCGRESLTWKTGGGGVTLGTVGRGSCLEEVDARGDTGSCGDLLSFKLSSFSFWSGCCITKCLKLGNFKFRRHPFIMLKFQRSEVRSWDWGYSSFGLMLA